MLPIVLQGEIRLTTCSDSYLHDGRRTHPQIIVGCLTCKYLKTEETGRYHERRTVCYAYSSAVLGELIDCVTTDN